MLKSFAKGLSTLVKAIKRPAIIIKESLVFTANHTEIANAIVLDNSHEDLALRLAKDGCTTPSAIILAEGLFNEGLKMIKAGMHPIDVKRQIDTQVKTAPATIDKIQLESGYLSPYFVTHGETMTAELTNPTVVTVTTCMTLADILPILEENQGPLLILGEVEGEALATLVMNKVKAGLPICAVNASCNNIIYVEKAIIEKHKTTLMGQFRQNGPLLQAASIAGILLTTAGVIDKKI